MTAPGLPVRSAAPIGAALLLALGLGLTAVGLAMGLAVAGTPDDPFGLVALASTVITNVAFGLVGALIVIRLPASRIGWLLLGTGVAGSGGFVAVAFESWADTLATPPAGQGLIRWLGSASWYLLIGFLFPRLLLLLPDGRLPSPRWRPVNLLQVLVLAALAVLIAAEALALLTPVPAPVGRFLEFAVVVEQYGYVLVLALMLIAAVSMVVRLRRSRGIERLQLKWIGWVVLLLVIGFLVSGVLEVLSPPLSELVGSLTFAVIGALPVAIGVAVLRYRLYDIDRLISRTIGWAVVTGVLVGVFAVVVVALQALLTPVTEENTLAVAASTLVAFALFQPVRRRVQRTVDRRFDRSRYDAQQVVDAFGERLRGLVDPGSLELDVAVTINAALRPSTSALWIRDTAGEAGRS